MENVNDILRSLGRIEGELVEIRELSERVCSLERWQSWLKGGWAVLAAACAYELRQYLGAETTAACCMQMQMCHDFNCGLLFLRILGALAYKRRGFVSTSYRFNARPGSDFFPNDDFLKLFEKYLRPA